ncbi:hypothetical protein Tco_0563312 [Tanacetum coccineum]
MEQYLHHQILPAAKLLVPQIRQILSFENEDKNSIFFLMTNYALWEVIVNGDSPLPKRIIDGVEERYPPTTVEGKLARKNELKAREINAQTELRKKFEKAKKEKDYLKLTLEKFENSSKNLSKLLEIQVSDKFKTGVGYDSQVVDSQVFDSQVNDKYKTGEGYHAVPPPYTGNFMPPKPNLVLADEEEYVFSESITSVLISDSEDENETEFKSKQRKLSFAKVEFVKSNEHVKIPRESVKKVENNKKAKYPKKNSQSLRGDKRNWNNLMT